MKGWDKGKRQVEGVAGDLRESFVVLGGNLRVSRIGVVVVSAPQLHLPETLHDTSNVATGHGRAQAIARPTIFQPSDVILRSEIDDIQATAKSVMPENLETQLSKQDLADLIAYLQAVAVPPKKDGEK